MIEEQEVIRTARAKSAEMISAAEAKSSQLRRVASEYVDNIMRQTEESMNAALATIQNAHNSFRSLGGGQPAGAEGERREAHRSRNYPARRGGIISTADTIYITVSPPKTQDFGWALFTDFDKENVKNLQKVSLAFCLCHPIIYIKVAESGAKW